MRSIIPIFLLAVLSLCSEVLAQYRMVGFRSDVSKVGTTAAPFLTIGIGARANAMGGAFTSIADDATALYWNPAGIGNMTSNQLALIHSDWIADLRHDYIGFVTPVGMLGVLGFSFNALTMDDILVSTTELPEGTGEKAESYDLAMGVTFARGLTNRLILGGTIKYIRSQLWHMSAQTTAFDLGVKFTDILGFIDLGACLSNMGSRMKYTGRDVYVTYDIAPNQKGNNEKIDADLRTGNYNLPITFRTGLSTVLMKKSFMPLTVSVEFFEPSDNVRSLNLGGEWALHDFVFLRGGYASLFVDDSETGLTLGGGLKIKIPFSTSRLFLDYSYEDFGILHYTQQFSLKVSF